MGCCKKGTAALSRMRLADVRRSMPHGFLDSLVSDGGAGTISLPQLRPALFIARGKRSAKPPSTKH